MIRICQVSRPSVWNPPPLSGEQSLRVIACALPRHAALTVRAWFLGIFFAAVACAINVFFQFRNPAPTIPPLVIQCVAGVPNSPVPI
jgi:hypothetical protein